MDERGSGIVLEVRNVSYCYPPPNVIKAVKNVSFNAKAGELLTIVGQNGSGKTTLAKCLSGYLKPQEGTIKIGGMSVTNLKRCTQRAQLVGYIFQNPDHQLFKDSVWLDVAFGLENMGVNGSSLERQVNSILSRLGLYEQRSMHPMRLSKGDRQRLAIACILAIKPKVLIVDEPTTGQDMMKSRGIMELLKEVAREGFVVIAITHSMELVAEFADRVVVMGDGSVLLDSDPRTVFAQAEILERTFISPPVVCQLAIKLGLSPLPLTVSEIKERIKEVLST